MTFFIRMAALALAVATAFVAAAPASAETTTFRIRSNYDGIIHFQLYSADRNWVWPRAGRVWIVDDFRTRSYPITCRFNEKICYGAWLQGRTGNYWGRGYDAERACPSCCFRCRGGRTTVFVLNP